MVLYFMTYPELFKYPAARKGTQAQCNTPLDMDLFEWLEKTRGETGLRKSSVINTALRTLKDQIETRQTMEALLQ